MPIGHLHSGSQTMGRGALTERKAQGSGHNTHQVGHWKPRVRPPCAQHAPAMAAMVAHHHLWGQERNWHCTWGIGRHCPPPHQGVMLAMWSGATAPPPSAGGLTWGHCSPAPHQVSQSAHKFSFFLHTPDSLPFQGRMYIKSLCPSVWMVPLPGVMVSTACDHVAFSNRKGPP